MATVLSENAPRPALFALSSFGYRAGPPGRRWNPIPMTNGHGQRRRFGRAAFAAMLTALVAAAVVAARIAENSLSDGSAVSLGLLELRLTYNTGVAFSLGDALPAWVIVVVTGGITLLVAGYGWHTATTGPAVMAIGLCTIAAGAAANVLDRTVDGRVTDYFHTGWFPTFNLPDVYITIGAVLLLASTVLASANDRRDAVIDRDEPTARPGE